MTPRAGGSGGTALVRAAAFAAALAGLGTLGACTFSSRVTVKSHELIRPPQAGLVNSYNLQEQYERGSIPEILDYFAAQPASAAESPRAARYLGLALLERGDFANAIIVLERAFGQEGRSSDRAELAWALSQAAYWQGDFGSAARWARAAQRDGRRIPDGWVAFLEALSTEKLLVGPEPGARVALPMIYGRPEIVRVAASLNGHDLEEVVVDSGASLSLLTESLATRAGVQEIPGAVASALGLHAEEFPLKFGLLKSLKLGDVEVRNVPVGILQDGALTFQTSEAGELKFPGVLGVHFLKEFDWRLEFVGKRIYGVRLDPAIRRGGKGQNVFFRRMKPMVRASINQEPWFLFLLDTGSEPTMVTRTGLQRAKYVKFESAYPVTLEGIGQSRVTWGKISNLTVGVDRFMATFQDIVVKEEAEGLQDGIVGNSFLDHFDVELRFSTMTLGLKPAFDRFLQEGAPSTGAPGR